MKSHPSWVALLEAIWTCLCSFPSDTKNDTLQPPTLDLTLSCRAGNGWLPATCHDKFIHNDVYSLHLLACWKYQFWGQGGASLSAKQFCIPQNWSKNLDNSSPVFYFTAFPFIKTNDGYRVSWIGLNLMGKLIEFAFQLKLFPPISQTYMRTGMQRLTFTCTCFKKNKS